MSKPSFDMRLAALADQVRALEGGVEIARALIGLAGDVEAHIQNRASTLHDPESDVFQKWNAFLNQSLQEAYRHGEVRLIHERHRLARLIAGDPRWTSGYADVLALLALDD